MHTSASKKSVSLASDAESTAPSPFMLVLVGVDGFLRGYQVNLPSPSSPIEGGSSGKRTQSPRQPPQQHCVLRWKTKLPGLGEAGLAGCTAHPFLPPTPPALVNSPHATPAAAVLPNAKHVAALLQHTRCSHCRNALFQHELRHQQHKGDTDGTDDATSASVTGELPMMESDAYLPENWLAVFPPFVPDPVSTAHTERGPHASTTSKVSGYSGPAFPSMSSTNGGSGINGVTLSSTSTTMTTMTTDNALTTRTSSAFLSPPPGAEKTETDDGVVLVRRPHWYWWEAPESERLPAVDCLGEGEGCGHGQTDRAETEEGADGSMGAWMRFQDAVWNRGSCPWHRLTPLFQQTETFAELDVLSGVLHDLREPDTPQQGTVPSRNAKDKKSGGGHGSSTPQSPRSIGGGDYAVPVLVPLLLRTHRTTLFSAPPTRDLRHNGANAPVAGQSGGRRAYVGRGASSHSSSSSSPALRAAAPRVTADLEDTELSLALDLTESERQMAQQVCTFLRCAADGVVDVFAPRTAASVSFRSASSPSLPSSPCAENPRNNSGGRLAGSAGRSHSARLDELMERVEAEAPTVAAFAVMLVSHRDGSTEALVLPLPVHAAEMEEALSVSSGLPSATQHMVNHRLSRCGSAGQRHPESVNGVVTATTTTQNGESSACGVHPQDSLASLTVSSSTPGFQRERMLSGLLLQSEGAPMQLVQGAHMDDPVSFPAETDVSTCDFYSDIQETSPTLSKSQEAVKGHNVKRSTAGDGAGHDIQAKKNGTEAHTSSDDSSSDDSSSSSSTSSSSSDTDDDDDDDDDVGSAIETATTASTRVSFAMPTRSESSVWTAPPPLSSDAYRRAHGWGGGSGSGATPRASTAAPSPTSFFDENFDPVLLLGRGTSGAALLARHRTTGVFYAVKVLLARDYESERAILHEVSLHGRLQNRHLVRYHSCWSELVTPKRAMQLSFVGLCDSKEALVAPPPPVSPDYEGGLSRHRHGVSDEHLFSGAARPFGQAARATAARVPRRMHWGSLQLGAGQIHHAGGPRLLIGEDSLSGTSLSSMATDKAAPPGAQKTKRSTVTWDRPRTRHGGRHAFALAQHGSSAAIVDVCSSDDEDDARDDHRGTRPSAGHLSLTELSQDEEEEEEEDNDSSTDDDDDDEGTFTDGTDYHEGAVIGSRLIFLQMEYCQTTLAHHLVQRARIDRVTNLVILLQLVSGLRYLHQLGILHRDVKPTNIFVDFRCQLATAPANLGSSDDDETGGDALHMSAAATTVVAEPGALIDPHCTTLSCLPHSGSLWSVASSVTHRLDGSDLDNGSTEDLLQQEMLEMIDSRNFRSSEEMLRERRAQHVVSYSDLYAAAGSPAATSSRRMRETPRAASAPPPPAPPKTLPTSPVVTKDALLRKDYRWLLERLVQVRLGDFGLAKSMQQQARFDIQADGFHSMNSANTVGVGSPVYSSPEQLNGRHCTSASDAYSLGVVMAEMYLQPTTVAERLVTLREVRDGVFPSPALTQQYPELSLVKALTNPTAARRVSLQTVHRELKKHLMEYLQRDLFGETDNNNNNNNTNNNNNNNNIQAESPLGQ